MMNGGGGHVEEEYRPSRSQFEHFQDYCRLCEMPIRWHWPTDREYGVPFERFARRPLPRSRFTLCAQCTAKSFSRRGIIARYRNHRTCR